MAAARAMIQIMVNQPPNMPSARAPAIQMISSFEKNPAKGQIPAMARVAIHMVIQVMGMYFLSPPMFRMSWGSAWLCVWCRAWCMEWITAPDPRKRSALKKAWVMRWKTPAA